MTDKLRALEQKFRERARVARGLRDGSASPDADWHGGMASCADICADELADLIGELPPSEAGEGDRPVAWAVELEDGTIGGFGWASMDTFPTVQKVATLREGCRYVFAYRTATPPAAEVDGCEKPGLCLGGESVTVNLSSLRSLHERGIIEEAPKQSGDAFWLTRYRLKEPQS